MPNRDCTALPTWRPTASLPENETMSTSELWTTASPTSLPPVTRPATAPGTPFFSSTLETIFVTAMEQSGVLGAGFQSVAFPAAKDNARFLLSRYTVIKLVLKRKWESHIPAVDRHGEVECGQDRNHSKGVGD